MTGWLLAALFLAIAAGPALRWLSTNRAPTGNQHVFDSASGVIMWTLAALLLVLYWSYSRGEKVRQACASFQEKMRSQRLTDEQFAQIANGKWWSICNPDSSDDQSGEQ